MNTYTIERVDESGRVLTGYRQDVEADSAEEALDTYREFIVNNGDDFEFEISNVFIDVDQEKEASSLVVTRYEFCNGHLPTGVHRSRSLGGSATLYHCPEGFFVVGHEDWTTGEKSGSERVTKTLKNDEAYKIILNAFKDKCDVKVRDLLKNLEPEEADDILICLAKNAVEAFLWQCEREAIAVFSVAENCHVHVSCFGSETSWNFQEIPDMKSKNKALKHEALKIFLS